MKKGSLNFLGRKNQSLFGTNVEFKDMGNVELLLNSAAVPESGTAKVRSRPTVKHFTSSDGAQGFAVPTPKVPILPPLNEPKMNGTGSTARLPNGGMLSIPEMIKGEILVPPPPSSAPPPPPPSSTAPRPPSFIPPPPKFFGEMDPSIDLASLQPPPMQPPKPPSRSGSEYSADVGLASLKPPPMAPPKPPSDTSSLRGSISSLDIQDIPECPKFTPPPPPGTKPPPVLPKAQKAPPLKPFRMSSIPNMEIQPQEPTPPAASTKTPSSFNPQNTPTLSSFNPQNSPKLSSFNPQNSPKLSSFNPQNSPSPSSFNPQNTAKLYNVQKSTLLIGQDGEKQAQSILLLEDSAGNPVGVHVKGNGGKSPGSFQPVQSVALPAKPARHGSTANLLQNDQTDMAENFQVDGSSQSAKTETIINPEPVRAPTPQNVPNETPTAIKVSPIIEKKPSAQPDASQMKPPVEFPGRSHRHSPLLNHRHLNRNGVGSAKKESSASPFALLMAAKERDKQRTNLSQQNSGLAEPLNSVIQPSPTQQNSFTVIPRDPMSDRPTVELKPATNTPPIVPPSPKAEVPNVSFSKPVLNPAPSPNFTPKLNPTLQPSSTPLLSFTPQQSPAHRPVNGSVGGQSVLVRDVESGEELPFIPPPPEFANFDLEDEPPGPLPSHHAPAPPVKTAPLPAKPSLPAPPAPTTNRPLMAPKPKPPSCPPKAPGPPPNVLPKPPVQTNPAPPPAQTPPSVAANQATLLSILQKKMLEMDPKFSNVKKLDFNDDWNSPLSDDEGMSPAAGSKPLQNLSPTLPAQPRGLDMKELETKAAKKAQNSANSTKSQNSNGPSNKQQFGMTFTVRPGSKQPIIPLIKDGSP
ncbi:uncharacterized protein LOC127439113 [Myxocyprinus asiaticus]|uniref:uncharacterized protein LOC127439113 n=1 Tax=Myxocyprinus asiaticus TaxID=70543 RepID=UPI0022215CA5|nr:uncharacterized protein LOC127439113 [Myxocyprinus asiaticus]